MERTPGTELSQWVELPHVKSSRREDRCLTTNLLQGKGGKVGRKSKRELVEAVRPRYGRAKKQERGRILDEFCAATGYHRVYARRLLGRTPPVAPARQRTGRPVVYGSVEVALLRMCWEIADGICGKRLAPFLGQLLTKLEACGVLPDEAPPEVVARVAGMSAASIDRALGRDRAAWPKRGLGTTKPGTLLRHQIPIKTFAEWDHTQPGFLEMDLVAHCGQSGAGEFLFTLSTVDVATSWSACVGVRNKGEDAVFRALCQLRTELPFPLLGLDSDNGSEFINRAFFRYCSAEGITFTRGRPYRKNDSCHIEQKNWSVVRRLVGYARFELYALPALNRVHALARDYVNFLQPVLKLIDKTRDGARVRKRYDRAGTPYQRVLASGVLSPETAAVLAERYTTLNPFQLKIDLELAQQALYAKAVRPGPDSRQRVNPGEHGLLRQPVAHENIYL